MMKHWTVTNKADGIECLVITEKGQTPFDCGYDAETHDAVALSKTKLGQRELEIKRATLLEAVKRIAAQKIEAVAPLWRQINDLYDGPSPEAADRKTKVRTERTKSNEVEAELAKAKTTEELLRIFDEYASN